ncbi:hypothetical protein N658DRAFT_530932 [Parathielavia hyrcaniae]|uniref:Uncharacterized protein n=1 Tax=Parathielavia hyrcaniae TaxID=113614 RepID=A0AAN6Q1X0_9PEZI|nr:hypothetical protein N658DRAFT_530932 [Parathielavia hyrcaniae]
MVCDTPNQATNPNPSVGGAEEGVEQGQRRKLAALEDTVALNLNCGVFEVSKRRPKFLTYFEIKPEDLAGQRPHRSSAFAEVALNQDTEELFGDDTFKKADRHNGANSLCAPGVNPLVVAPGHHADNPIALSSSSFERGPSRPSTDDQVPTSQPDSQSTPQATCPIPSVGSASHEGPYSDGAELGEGRKFASFLDAEERRPYAQSLSMDQQLRFSLPDPGSAISNRDMGELMSRDDAFRGAVGHKNAHIVSQDCVEPIKPLVSVPECHISTPGLLYTELPSNDHFRLLEILPGAGEARLQCRMHVCSLYDNRGAYEAISYTWMSDWEGMERFG